MTDGNKKPRSWRGLLNYEAEGAEFEPMVPLQALWF